MYAVRHYYCHVKMWLNSWNILHSSLKKVASDLKHKIISWHSYYVLSFSAKPVVIKPIASCTCDHCPTIKLHGFIDMQCYKLTRDKTSKNSYRKISLASASIGIFLMETSNTSCQKYLEIDPSPYRLHESEFTTPSIEKGISRYWFYPGFLRKSVLHLLCECFWPSVFQCVQSLPPQKPQNKPKPFWTQQAVVNHIWQSGSLKDRKILQVWWK